MRRLVSSRRGGRLRLRGRRTIRVSGALLGRHRSPSYFPSSDTSSAWITTSEYTEGIVPTNHAAIHGTRLDARKKQIRVLRLLPHDPIRNPDDETVHCRMIRLSHLPPLYNALSYVWGSTGEQTNIVINGATTSVGTNLESALRHFRDYHGKITCDFPLWVDAVCINQEDANERSSQVEMMGDVYRRAYRVFPWLGEGSDDTDWLLPLFRDVAFREKIEQVFEASDPAREPHIVRACAVVVGDLSLRVWWTRLWIVQEVMLAKCDPVIVVGRQSLRWSDYVPGYLRLLNIQPRVYDRDGWKAAVASLYISIHRPLPFINPTGSPVMAVKSWDDLRCTIQGQGHTSLRDLLTNETTLNRCALQEHDHIYALRGLLSKEEQKLIKVDYTKPYMQVFHDAMRVVWTSSYSALRLADVPWIFSYRRSHTSDKAHDVPSWVPDLALQSVDLQPNFTSVQDLWRTPVIRISPDGSTLTLHGVEFDTVTETCSVRFRGDEPDLGDLQLAVLLVTTALDHAISPSTSLHTMIGYRARDKHESQILRIMMKPLSSLSAHVRLVKSLWSSLLATDPEEAEVGARKILEQHAENALHDQPNAFSAQSLVAPFLWGLMYRLAGNVIFITKAGSFGVGPGHMQAGDQIVFPFGMTHPFVVRPVDSEHPEKHEYTMVGVAEVPDLCDEHREGLDEAYEAGLLEEIEINLK